MGLLRTQAYFKRARWWCPEIALQMCTGCTRTHRRLLDAAAVVLPFRWLPEICWFFKNEDSASRRGRERAWIGSTLFLYVLLTNDYQMHYNETKGAQPRFCLLLAQKYIICKGWAQLHTSSLPLCFLRLLSCLERSISVVLLVVLLVLEEYPLAS